MLIIKDRNFDLEFLQMMRANDWMLPLRPCIFLAAGRTNGRGLCARLNPGASTLALVVPPRQLNGNARLTSPTWMLSYGRQHQRSDIRGWNRILYSTPVNCELITCRGGSKNPEA